MQVLSMDGIGTAKGCRNVYKSFFSSKVTLYNTLLGTLPTCVWSLPRIETLHVAGEKALLAVFVVIHTLIIQHINYRSSTRQWAFGDYPQPLISVSGGCQHI